MGAELKDIADSIGELKKHFDTSVGEMKDGLGRVDTLTAAVDEMKTRVTAGEASIGELTEVKDALKEQRTLVEEKGAKLDEVIAQMAEASTRLDEAEAAAKRLPQGMGEEEKSLGAQFVESEAYKSFNATTGKISDAVEVKTFFPRARKAGELTGASLGNVAGYLYQPQRVPGIIVAPEIQPRVRDLFPVNPISVGSVEFVRETGFTNAAAPTAETVAKPQSALEFELDSRTVRTIAHWLPVSRQILADAAQLEAYINTRLVYGLALTEDDELLNGDGSAAHLTGLLTDEDVQTITQGDAAAADNMADTIRRAITLVEIAGYPANGVLLHPSDWESIELLKDEDGRYLFAQPQQRAARQMWGLPVVTSLAMSLGQFSCGAYNLAAAIWDREQSQVRLSDQHDDFFTRNLVAILAEERLALTVYRPEAVVLGTFTGSGS